VLDNIDVKGFYALIWEERQYLGPGLGESRTSCTTWKTCQNYHVGSGHNVDKLNDYIKKKKLNMIVATQPPQSPDFNVMDLSMWYSLQSQVHRVRFEHATTGVPDYWCKSCVARH
jgi:hypothetical protein